MSFPLTTPSRDESSRSRDSSDQCRWAAEAGLDLYGLRVGIRSNRADLLTQMLLRLPTGWKHARARPFDRSYSLWADGADYPAMLYRGSRLVLQNVSCEEALARLEYDVELFVVENNPERVFVHAGVVGWHGRAIVIPGRSYSGKSTLVAALCRAGATYYSDEYALFDADGRIHPYPRPLRLRAPRDGQLPVADELNLRVGDGPLPLGLIVLTHYQPAVFWQPRMVSPGEALLALLANTMSARRRPQFVLTALQCALTSSRVLASPRGEAKETTEQLLQLAGG